LGNKLWAMRPVGKNVRMPRSEGASGQMTFNWQFTLAVLVALLAIAALAYVNKKT